MTSGSVEQVTETVTGRLRSKKASKPTGQEPNSDVTNITEARSFKRHKQQIPDPGRPTRAVLTLYFPILSFSTNCYQHPPKSHGPALI